MRQKIKAESKAISSYQSGWGAAGMRSVVSIWKLKNGIEKMVIFVCVFGGTCMGMA